jgi:hypothetical protein
MYYGSYVNHAKVACQHVLTKARVRNNGPERDSEILHASVTLTSSDWKLSSLQIRPNFLHEFNHIWYGSITVWRQAGSLSFLHRTVPFTWLGISLPTLQIWSALLFQTVRLPTRDYVTYQPIRKKQPTWFFPSEFDTPSSWPRSDMSHARHNGLYI